MDAPQRSNWAPTKPSCRYPNEDLSNPAAETPPRLSLRDPQHPSSYRSGEDDCLAGGDGRQQKLTAQELPTPSQHNGQQLLLPRLGSSSRFGHFLPATFPEDRPFVPSEPVVSEQRQPREHLPRVAGQPWSQGGEHVLPSPGASDTSLRSGSSASPGSLQAHHELSQGQNASRVSFNRSLYPGYDEDGHRRGLDHLHVVHPSENNGKYYPARTYAYPPVETSGDPSISSQENLTASGKDGTLAPLSGFPRFPFHETASSTSSTPAPQSALLQPSPTAHERPVYPLTPVSSQVLDTPEASTAFAEPSTLPLGTPDDIAQQHSETEFATAMGFGPGPTPTLASLQDPQPGRKPEYTYPTLVALCIKESEKQALTLQEIYEVLERRFSWFANCENPTTWKNSIRHSLSLLKVFVKKSRPVTEPGKGHYWTIDTTKTGYKRVRKRNKKLTKKQLAQRDAVLVDSEEDAADSDNVIDPVLQAQSKSNDQGHRVDVGVTRTRTRSGKAGQDVRTRSNPYPAPEVRESRYPRMQQATFGGTSPSDGTSVQSEQFSASVGSGPQNVIDPVLQAQSNFNEEGHRVGTTRARARKGNAGQDARTRGNPYPAPEVRESRYSRMQQATFGGNSPSDGTSVQSEQFGASVESGPQNFIDPVLQAQSNSNEEGHRVGTTRTRARKGNAGQDARTRGNPYPAPEARERPSRVDQAAFGGASPSNGSTAQLEQYNTSVGSGPLQPPQWHASSTSTFMTGPPQPYHAMTGFIHSGAELGNVQHENEPDRRLTHFHHSDPQSQSQSQLFQPPPLSLPHATGPRFGQAPFGANSFSEAFTSAGPAARAFMDAAAPTPIFGGRGWLGSGQGTSSSAIAAASAFDAPREVRALDRNAPVRLPPPRPGIELVVTDGGLPRARRVTAPAGRPWHRNGVDGPEDRA